MADISLPISQLITSAQNAVANTNSALSGVSQLFFTPANGGPDNNGIVVLTDGVLTVNFPSLAKLQQEMKKGDTGPQGPQGVQGIKGDKGDKGDTGLQGVQGIQGVKGDTGAQGIQGVKGDTGAQGIQGLKGDKGDKGDTGATGPAGSVSNVPWSAITDKPTTLVQSNTVPTFTGGVNGDDGGEVRLARPLTGTAIQGDVVIDVYRNTLRFLESQGNNRGAYLPLNLMANGADARIWTSADFLPASFAANSHLHAIADVNGLQTALNAKAPTAGPTFTGTATFNGVNAATVALNTGLLYPDGNHTLLKTGASGSEKYWRWDANGTLYALSGGLDAAGDLRTNSKLIVGPNDGAANSTTMGPGYMEMRSQAFGAYIDLSNANSTAMDFGGRLQYAGTNLTISNGAGGNIVIGSGNVFANSSDGAQAGRVLTQDGSEQIVTKNVAYQNAGNDDFHAAPAAGLEVRGKGGNTAAMMRFHRPGAYGAQLGLGTDNHLRWGGWSEGTVSYRVLTEKWAPISIESDSGKLLMRDGSGWASAHGVRTQPGDGNGIRFWNNDDSYSISMGSSSWGGRIWEGTSDYNMYFKMTGGTNRGFNFKNGNNVVAGIDGGGTLRLNGSVEAAGEVYVSNWFRVRGSSQGIYWEQHGGGWQMSDSTYMRAYNDKNIYTGGWVQGNNAKLGYGVDVGLYTDVSNLAIRTPHAQGTIYLQGSSGQSTYGIIGNADINWYRPTYMNGNWISFNNAGLNNGLRFQVANSADMRIIQKQANYIHITNESGGYEVFNIDSGGAAGFRTSVTAPSITATSDARLKHSVVALDGALELVSRIKPSRFCWNVDDREDIGVIAQELEQDIPQAVRTGHDGMKSVNYNALTVVNTAAIQAMMQELAALSSDVQDMKARLH